MLAYFVSRSHTDTSSISLMLFRGPLIILHVLLVHFSSFSFTTYYNEKAGTSQARTCSFYVDHFIHRFFSFFYFTQVSTSFFCIFYFIISAVLLLCCVVFLFFFSFFSIIWIFVYILLPFIHPLFSPLSVFFIFFVFRLYSVFVALLGFRFNI